MQEQAVKDKDFIKKVVRAYLFFKDNPSAIKKGSVAETLYRLLDNKMGEAKEGVQSTPKH